MRGRFQALVATLAVLALSMQSAMATWTPPTVDYDEAAQTTVTSVAGQINLVLPVAVVLLAIGLGYRWFKKLIKSA